MISGNPVYPQSGPGPAQYDPAFVEDFSWLGRTARAVEVVTCLVSGVVTVAAVATNFFSLAAVTGAIFFVTGLSLLADISTYAVDSSELFTQPLSDPGEDDQQRVYHTDTDYEFYLILFQKK